MKKIPKVFKIGKCMKNSQKIEEAFEIDINDSIIFSMLIFVGMTFIIFYLLIVFQVS